MSEPSKARPSVIVLDLDDEAEALHVAKVIASKTGRVVTLRDADGIEIETVSPIKH
jgi:glycerol-3-phosphate dehydrogenase